MAESTKMVASESQIKDKEVIKELYAHLLGHHAVTSDHGFASGKPPPWVDRHGKCYTAPSPETREDYLAHTFKRVIEVGIEHGLLKKPGDAKEHGRRQIEAFMLKQEKIGIVKEMREKLREIDEAVEHIGDGKTKMLIGHGGTASNGNVTPGGKREADLAWVVEELGEVTKFAKKLKQSKDRFTGK